MRVPVPVPCTGWEETGGSLTVAAASVLAAGKEIAVASPTP